MPEATRKLLQQGDAIKTTTTRTGGEIDKTEDGEGTVGDLPGYVTTGEDQQIREV